MPLPDRKDERVRRPVELSGQVRAYVKRHNFEKNCRHYEIWYRWSELLGERMSKRAFPLSYKSGTLVVIVSDAVWMQELNHFKEDYIKKINEAVKLKIKDVRFVWGSMPAEKAKAETPPNPLFQAEPLTKREVLREPTQEEKAFAQELADKIDDPQLREVFYKVVLSDLTKIV